ncbi:unnamed protein product [Pneumocystis jirovecii]|uniref:Vacuolar protein-sorting-associated protein 36 n=1 Tax=Pneumocystis jirovecii TaxID=42068 RepID=L0PEM2_PNEJI|nr:unnamed protein product [Pneumocystis jirovecii]
MKYWKYIDITQTNHPMLFSGEKILFIQSSVGLYDPSSFFKKDVPEDGTVYLTTHRICYIHPFSSCIEPLGLDLSEIEKLDTSTRLFKTSFKIIIYYKKPDSTYESETLSPVPSTNAWICTVCSFYNSVPKYHPLGRPFPPCLACGVSTYNILNYSKPSSAVNFNSAKNKISSECKKCTFLNHPALKECESCGAHLISQEKDTLSLDSNLDLKSTDPSTLKQNIVNDCCTLIFKSGGEQIFYERLKEAINQKLWTTEINPIDHNADKNWKMGGISVLQYTKENNRLNNAHILNQGLSDLNTLMSKAKELVTLANSLRLKLQASPNVSDNARNTLQTSIQTMGLQEQMLSHDLSNYLVTKAITKDDNTYYNELAKQIAEFLETGVLKREGGIMTLADVFALYNRARGVDLISPEDLLKACQCYKTLNLSIQLKRFQSGLLVLQEKEKDDKKIINQISSWIKNIARGVTPFEVADQFQWSMGIAYEALKV